MLLLLLSARKVALPSPPAATPDARPSAMADSPKSIARRKWGRFLPHQRANVDQVPLPFVNDMEVTYEQKGAKRVCINKNCLACQRVWRGFLTPSAKAHAGFS